ncbi:hypothetical protein PAHAL_1G082300 [Panicum hallii]|uniref:Uncharacterized protein n=1 Tax=Panicum hallii TaxID=206008 RepID=A0A2S3GMJ5_9POAL|nr:hypothetical protein PAHAL_1G082300 [Panicum hallii]
MLIKRWGVASHMLKPEETQCSERTNGEPGRLWLDQLGIPASDPLDQRVSTVWWRR